MPPVTIDGSLGITTPMYNGAITANAVTPVLGMKNKLINGQMQIDQRNAGASVTPTADGPYSLDRWQIRNTQSSKLSVQQNAGSVTPPAGFTNYLGVTSLSAYSVNSTDWFNIRQQIEGFNVADLGWGTANAKTVTLSFWVRSSLTGTFGGCLNNNAFDRAYPFTYTISSANTWEQKSITIAGDTTGTWLTNSSCGIAVSIGLGIGSTYSGTAGAWTGTSLILGATGATSVVGTNGATFFLTGVQLEVGSTATSFDYRPYGTELALCQRYYENSNGSGGTIANSDAYVVTTSATQFATFIFKVGKRISPTVTPTFSGGTGATFAVTNGSFYQNTAHSVASTFGWTASAEL
jgi:hypothetical protein